MIIDSCEDSNSAPQAVVWPAGSPAGYVAGRNDYVSDYNTGYNYGFTQGYNNGYAANNPPYGQTRY